MPSSGMLRHCYSENLAVPGIETGTSVSAARNSDHAATEAVQFAPPSYIIPPRGSGSPIKMPWHS
jgi:hypothetical protein